MTPFPLRVPRPSIATPVLLAGALLIAASPAALSAALQSPAGLPHTDPDPVTFVDGPKPGPEGLGKLLVADLDRDGRLDVASTRPGMPVRLLSTPAERLHRDVIEGSFRDAAIQPLSEGDALLTAGPDGLERWVQLKAGDGFTGTTVLSGSFEAVVEQAPAGLPFDLVCALDANRRTVHVAIGMLGTGDWLAFLTFDHAGVIERIETFDLDGDSRPEIAVTDAGGLAVYTIEGIFVTAIERPPGTLASEDRLVRLVDAENPVEELAWIAADSDGGSSLTVVNATLSANAVQLGAAAVGQAAAADLDGDGLADLVLPDPAKAGFRIILSTGSDPRFKPGTAQDGSVAGFVGPSGTGGPRDGACIADFDRDGDLDLAGAADDEFFLVRNAAVDHRAAQVSIDDAFSFVTTFDEEPGLHSFELMVDAPQQWSGSDTLNYRVWHRPSLATPVTVVPELVAAGKVELEGFPLSVPFDIQLPEGDEDVWYIELELEGEGGALEPSVAYFLAPTDQQLVDLETVAGGALWGVLGGVAQSAQAPAGGVAQGGSSASSLAGPPPAGGRRSAGPGLVPKGEGTTGTVGLGDSPRIPPVFL